MNEILSLKEIKEKVNNVAVKKEYIKEIYLFGSYARGTATEKSDIDLHIVFEDIPLGLKVFELSAELESETGKYIDNVFNDEFYRLQYGNTQNERILLYKKETTA